MSGNNAWKVGLAVVAVLALVGGLFFALSGDDAAAPTSAGPSVTTDPTRGPSGTPVTVKFRGGDAEADYVVLVSGQQTPARTDANGDFDATVTISGPAGNVLVEVLTDQMVPVTSANYEILAGEATTTSSTSTTSTIPDSVPPASFDFEIAPSDSGAADIEHPVTIKVSNGPPGEPVTVNVPKGASGATIDANGNYEIPAVFKGPAGTQRDVVVRVGGGTFRESTQTKAFKFTGAAAKDTAVNVGPDRGADPTTATITMTGDPFSPVILTIDGQDVAGVPDTDDKGKSSHQVTFTGDPRTIAITAKVGSGKSASTEFELTSATIPIGTYTTVANFQVDRDPGGHAGPIGMPGEVEFEVEVASITITGTPPFVAVSGDLADDGSFDITASGEVAGFADVGVRFVGSVTTDGLVGQYSMGTGGELPGGEAITYAVATTGLDPVGAGTEGLIEFYERLSVAQATGDVDFLFDALHPAVIDRYGTDQCVTYLESIINPSVGLAVVEESGSGPFVYETDGVLTDIAEAIDVSVEVTTDDGSSVVDTHAVDNGDGTFAWFSDCGDPV